MSFVTPFNFWNPREEEACSLRTFMLVPYQSVLLASKNQYESLTSEWVSIFPFLAVGLLN